METKSCCEKCKGQRVIADTDGNTIPACHFCSCHKESPVSQSVEGLKEFVEKGADIEHDRWARWQKYMFSKGSVDAEGVFHLPKEFVDRWFRQIDTKYSDLSEEEKESDRKETRNYLPLLSSTLSTLVKEMEGLKKVPPNPNFGTSGAYNEANGFNAGISAAVEVIKKMV